MDRYDGSQQYDQDGHPIDPYSGSESNIDGPDGTGGTYAEGGLGYGEPLTSEPEHRIHFDFNSSQVTPEAQAILSLNVQWIAGQQVEKVIVEGHCDERGTREYNLALGQERAESVKRALVALGVDETRIQTISYGKERPLMHDHNEFAWDKNRRAEIVLQ
ncbi:MAG: peptidoglycan-associated lipoprotein Pal [Magnetococcales bacterium]|nr:peptidoglycan-associated lipoprotein Pal [Magnetococcales bacterium]